MKIKRLTKAQTVTAQKAALLRRVNDVYAGAQGTKWTADDFACAEQLGRVVPALRELFLPQHPQRGFAFEPHCLAYFDRPSTAADFLFREGFRA